MPLEIARDRPESEATGYLQCKMVASASWVPELKLRTRSTVLPSGAEEAKAVLGRIMFIL